LLLNLNTTHDRPPINEPTLNDHPEQPLKIPMKQVDILNMTIDRLEIFEKSHYVMFYTLCTLPCQIHEKWLISQQLNRKGWVLIFSLIARLLSWVLEACD